MTLTAETVNDYGGGAALGQVVAATTTTKRDDAVQGTTYTANTFVWRNGGAQIAKTTTTGQTASTTRYDYGVGGRLEAIAIADGRPRTVSIVSDLSGQVLARDESDDNTATGDPHERWYRFNGNELGHVGNDGGGADDYAGSIATRGLAPQSGPFGNNRSYGQTFAKSIDAITSYEQGASGGGYTVRTGDTLAGIATQLWGDAGLWYKLAAANGLTASAALTPGATLAVPAGVIRSTYNADQLRPYDPADAIGDVSPVSAQPTARGRKSNKCGTFGKILLVAIAVAVTVATAGAAAAALAPGAAAAAGGGIMGGLGVIAGGAGLAGGLSAGALIGIGAGSAALGSIASQGFGLATGIQDSFNWKGVALAGISGAVGAGLGSLGGAGVGGAMVRGAIGSALTQSIGTATGLQSKFDWAGVAAAGLAAGVGGSLSNRLSPLTKVTTLSNHLSHAGVGAAATITAAASRSLLTGTSFGDNVLAVLPDVLGSTIGNIVAYGVSGRPAATMMVAGQIQQLASTNEMLPPREWKEVSVRNAADAEQIALQNLAVISGESLLPGDVDHLAQNLIVMTRLGRSPSFGEAAEAFAHGLQSVDRTSGGELASALARQGAQSDYDGVTGLLSNLGLVTDGAGTFYFDRAGDTLYNYASLVKGPTRAGLAYAAFAAQKAPAMLAEQRIGAPLSNFADVVEGLELDHKMVHLRRGGSASDANQVIRMAGGSSGRGWDPELNSSTFHPDSEYQVNGYVYQTDANGRVVGVSGSLQAGRADRNEYRQRIVARSGGVSGDQGGHLVASIFNGPGDGINLVPMNANLNMGRWRAMERNWAGLIAAGNRVDVDISALYRGSSNRPSTFMVQHSINGAPQRAITYMNRSK